MRRFARFACIDWSGAAVARPPGLALAWCAAGTEAPALVDPPGGWSRPALADWLLDHAARGSDLLIGVDFSASLPFADAGAFFPGWDGSPADARALWALIDARAADAPGLGLGDVLADPAIAPYFRRPGGLRGARFGAAGGGRLRVTEAACRAAGLGPAQSSFVLVGPAQVGKSALTGMRLLHRLAGRLPVWPFDPVPARGPLLVEIYTGLAARAAGRRGATKLRDPAHLAAALAHLQSRPGAPDARHDEHRADAVLGAAWLRRAAGQPALWHPPALTPRLAAREGWTFGVP
ncbi:hypothetical protein [Sphingomonas morindae]|uniref:DUF429 domain-containing protein n=1 Tax=Sphingomonas morindae TaxID=1541170 RepID=A0ABY4X4B3_9SPHN|nr:hypothetical protein [Sphingomonas morindae]USI71738.1 hypothetical protein LHA26_10415 [Sphingomonas morindae]